MARGVVRKLNRVIEAVNQSIHREIDADSIYSRGLSGEGYDGGYRDAICDVLLALNGVQPRRNLWWEERKADNVKENTRP